MRILGIGLLLVVMAVLALDHRGELPRFTMNLRRLDSAGCASALKWDSPKLEHPAFSLPF
jgi:hypothetical protein